MNLTDMMVEVYTGLDENPASPVFWDDSDIKEALNHGYQEMADASEFYEKTDTIDFEKGATYIDLAALSSELVRFTAIHNRTTKRWLDPVNVQLLDHSAVKHWGRVLGQPQCVFTRGLYNLGLYPRPEADQQEAADVLYIGMPPELYAADDVPQFPEQFHQGIVEYALYELFLQDGEIELALKHFAEYEAFEAALAKWVGRRGTGRLEVVGGNS